MAFAKFGVEILWPVRAADLGVWAYHFGPMSARVLLRWLRWFGCVRIWSHVNSGMFSLSSSAAGACQRNLCGKLYRNRLVHKSGIGNDFYP